MTHLIAQGANPHDVWRRPLAAGEVHVLGRDAAGWAVPWEPFLSRRHAELHWRDNRLHVRLLPGARNPIFHRGRESSSFELAPGEHFVIGHTLFTLAEESPASARVLIEEKTFSDHELRNVRFQNAPHRLDVLERLPEVILGAHDDSDLFVRLVDMLLAGIPRAEAASLVSVAPTPEETPAVDLLHADRRSPMEGALRPSERLVREAVRRERKTVLHLSKSGAAVEGGATLGESFDWAFCTPVADESCAGWGLYVAGRFAGDDAAATVRQWETAELHDDLKFTQLVATILGALRHAQRLQQQQASLGHFFSPAVLRTLIDNPEESLRPRHTEVTVLFCDLRGFSRRSEQSHDLLALLERVSQALGVMTQNIFASGGVIGDFQGDAAMAFWGWPVHQPDMVARACRAALGIRKFFTTVGAQPDHPLAGFEVGVGIATGTAVGGKIGTRDQVKMTIFGPVVNLASRLEGMTKILQAPILVDETTGRVMKESLPAGTARWRRVARVKPVGLDTSLVVTELLPPAADYPELTDAHLADYESAVDHLLAGRWPEAYEQLRKMPPEDRVPDFLTKIILENERKPPPGWDGVIELKSKR